MTTTSIQSTNLRLAPSMSQGQGLLLYYLTFYLAVMTIVSFTNTCTTITCVDAFTIPTTLTLSFRWKQNKQFTNKPTKHSSVIQKSSLKVSTSSSSESLKKPVVLLQTVVKEVPISSLIHYVKHTYKPPLQLPLPFSLIDVDSSSSTMAQWVCDFVIPKHVLTVEIVGIQKKRKDPTSMVMNMAMVAVKRVSGSAVDSLLLASEKQLLRDFEKRLEQLPSSSLPPVVDAELDSDSTAVSSQSPKTSSIEKKDNKASREDPNILGVKVDANRVIDADIVPSNSTTEEHQKKIIAPVLTKSSGSREIEQLKPKRSKYADQNSEQAFQDYSSRGLNIVVGDDTESKSEMSLSDFWNKDIDQLTSEEQPKLDDSSVSPEEFTQEFLNFAKKESNKDKEGASFAEGLFQAAREVVRESTSIQVEQSVGEENDPSFEEEELRRFFEAGRNIVEGKMAVVGSNNQSVIERKSALQSTQSKEKQIETELAELEVRILRNSWDEPVDLSERLDLFAPPPSFDETIFDPTSVNYPGALPGTKENIKIHDDLKQAIDYAQFAMKILSSLDEKVDEYTQEVRYFRNEIEMPLNDVFNLQKTINEAVKVGIVDSPQKVMAERSRLRMLVEELSRYSIDRFAEIAGEYKDLMLSDLFVPLVKERLAAIIDYDSKCIKDEIKPSEEINMKHDKEREALGLLVKQAMVLLKEVQALGAELEVMQLEIIRSICQVAMDPKYQTEEEAAIALTDAVRDMLPLLDETFVAYLKYAVAEEEAKLLRRGVLEDPEQNRWLCVLKIVQQGVYAEIGRKIARHVEVVWYCMRMKTRQQRRDLLKMNVDNMATMDIRPFRRVVDNIVGALGTAATGEFDEGEALGGWTKRILQLAEDIDIVLPPERMNILSRDADKWLEKQREQVLEQRRQTAELIQARKKGKEIADRYLSSGVGEIDRMP